MLKRENRLGEISLKKPRLISSKLFNIKFSKNGQEINRFAFVVSKRIDKRATVRNRIRRVTRSCVEEIFGDIKNGHDFIFYLKEESIGVPREEISQTIKKTFSENKLLI